MTATKPAIAANAVARPLVALGWMAVALVSFTLVAIAGREAGKSISTLELMAWRSWLSLPIILALIALSGVPWASVRSRQTELELLRAGIHFGAQFAWLKALTLIPLAKLFALEFTSPLWVALLAPLLLGERMTSSRLLAAIIGFIGALIVIFGGDGAANLDIDLGSLLALSSAVGFAVIMMATRRLTRTDSTWTILLYMFAFQSVISLPILLVGMTWPDTHSAIAIGGLTIFGLTAHFSIAKAFANADAMVVAPMDLMRLPLIALIGVWLYAEPLDPIVLVGGGVVIAANLLNLAMERRR